MWPRPRGPPSYPPARLLLQAPDLPQPVALGTPSLHEQPRREGAHGYQARPVLAGWRHRRHAESVLPGGRRSAAGGTPEAAPRKPVAGDDRKEAAPRTSCPAGGLQLPAAPAAPRLRPGRQDAAMAAAAVAAPEVLRECGCKGIRTCLICERQRGGDPPWQHPPQVRAGGRGRATAPFFIWGN